MTLEMLTDTIVCAASLISVVYGIFTMMIGKKALYLKMTVLAVACIMISRFHIMLQYFTSGAEIQTFHVGLLGIVGCYLFLLSSNYGAMDRLVDDGDPQYLKYRLLSWLAPLVLLGIYSQVFFAGTTVSRSRNIICSVAMLILLIDSRFHLKHLIFPDVDFGVVRKIRGYNAVSLVLCLATTVLMMADLMENSVLFLISGIVMALCCLIMLPLLRREVAKWTLI